MLVAAAAEDRLNIRRLAMSSLDKLLGWFPHSPTEWIEFNSGRASVAADGSGHIGA